MKNKLTWIFLMAALLAGCGGGDYEEPHRQPAVAAASLARPRVLLETTAEVTAFFDWAKATYPQYLSGTVSVDGYAAPYQYRYFGNNTYLGVAFGSVYVLGPFTNGEIRYLGTFASYSCQMHPASCAPPTVSVATLGGSGFDGFVNATGTAAKFNFPYGVAVDGSGNVFVADQVNNVIRKITPAGVVTTFAGSGAQGHANGAGAAASFVLPVGIAIDSAGNLYVSDTYNHLIRKITPAGFVSTLAGSGSPGWADGVGAAASFRYPNGIAVDATGNVFVGDTDNNVIRKITPDGTVTTFAGGGNTGDSGATGGDGSGADGIARSGTLVVGVLVDSTPLAGAQDGVGAVASFRRPFGVALDAAGNLYVADTGNNLIRKITAGRLVSHLAGSGAPGSRDGTGDSASFSGPGALAVDGSGNIFVADSNNNLIRKVTAGAVVTTIAGTGAVGGLNGDGTAATFHGPYGIAVDGSGHIFVGDTYGQLIRKLTVTTGTSYSLNVAISGLSTSGLVVQTGITNQASLAVSAGATTLAVPGLTLGTSYALSIVSQPTGQTCSLTSGTGQVAASGAVSPSIACTTNVATNVPTYSVGGKVTGLTQGQLVLNTGIKAAPSLTISAGAQVFAVPSVPSGTTYSFVVQAQPLGLSCNISNGTGAVQGAAIASVAIACTANTYTLGGMVTGVTNTGVYLLAGSLRLPIAAGADHFEIPVRLLPGSVYVLVVDESQATNLICEVYNNSGTIAYANVDSVLIECLPTTPDFTGAGAGGGGGGTSGDGGSYLTGPTGLTITLP
jgi:serine/threonine protein kinase, bacterial